MMIEPLRVRLHSDDRRVLELPVGEHAVVYLLPNAVVLRAAAGRGEVIGTIDNQQLERARSTHMWRTPRLVIATEFSSDQPAVIELIGSRGQRREIQRMVDEINDRVADVRRLHASTRRE